MKEIWRDVKGFDGLYQVSNIGRVRSLLFNKIKILSPRANKGGYLSTVFTKNKKRKNVYVHRLVAETFIPNIENKTEVNHIDSNRANNNKFNLEWCTSSENHLHSFKIGNRKPTGCWHKGRSGRTKGIAVVQIDANGVLLNNYKSLNEAEQQTGIKTGNISSVCRCVTRTAGGYIWKYQTDYN